LEGIIIRGALIGALSGDNQFINNNGTIDSAEQASGEVNGNE